MKKHRILLLFFLALLLGCKTPPPPLPPLEHSPSLLEFNRIEASAIDAVTLYFSLQVQNARTVPMNMEIHDWKLSINGIEANSDSAQLFIEGKAARQAGIPADPGAKLEKELVLKLDLAGHNLLKLLENADNYQAELKLNLVYHYGSSAPVHGEASAVAVFPRIREPVFSITSIAILQAELVNTRFRVSLRIDNPNPFPVALSSFKYELYGEGLYWAGGQEKNVLRIPAMGQAETKLFLTMNFINMKRHLLDEIIALRNVNYRFLGDVEVGTEIPWLPSFKMKFDRSGLSEVLK